MERKERANLLHHSPGTKMKKRPITFRCHSCTCVFTSLRHINMYVNVHKPGSIHHMYVPT